MSHHFVSWNSVGKRIRKKSIIAQKSQKNCFSRGKKQKFQNSNSWFQRYEFSQSINRSVTGIGILRCLPLLRIAVCIRVCARIVLYVALHTWEFRPMTFFRKNCCCLLLCILFCYFKMHYLHFSWRTELFRTPGGEVLLFMSRFLRMALSTYREVLSLRSTQQSIRCVRHFPSLIFSFCRRFVFSHPLFRVWSE